MLTRFMFRKDFRVIVRYVSDKSSGNDGKTPVDKSKAPETQKESSQSATDKIQELLKLMMAEPKFKEEEYKHKFTTAPEVPSRRKQKYETEIKTEKIEESITKAAGDVAQALGGDVKQTEAELLSRVLGKINQTTTNLSDLLIGMKIDHTKEDGEKHAVPTSVDRRGQQVKHAFMKTMRKANETRYIQRKGQPKGEHDFGAESRQKRQAQMQVTTVNIFSGQPLGIFNSMSENYGTQLGTWEKLKERELALTTSQTPTNYFQKMILWTEQGKVWKFPIDNEQGLESEKDVHFSEHVFLDAHLEGWCPTKGPIRHFMELVCVGLSKNAFYTIQEKKDHITWYKEYFESKKDLLTEIGAWDMKPHSEATSS